MTFTNISWSVSWVFTWCGRDISMHPVLEMPLSLWEESLYYSWILCQPAAKLCSPSSLNLDLGIWLNSSQWNPCRYIQNVCYFWEVFSTGIWHLSFLLLAVWNVFKDWSSNSHLVPLIDLGNGNLKWQNNNKKSLGSWYAGGPLQF